MRRSTVVAKAGVHPKLTQRILRNWAGRKDPEKIEVYYAMAEGVYPLGRCVRFWCQTSELWAEMDIREDRAHLWPDPSPAELHCEIVASQEGSTLRMLSVLVTTMPHGVAGLLLQEGDRKSQARRLRN